MEAQIELFQDCDFIENAIRHIIRDKQCFRAAKGLKMTEDDVGGIDIYRAFISIAMEINEAPIGQKLFLTKIKEAYKTGKLNPAQQDEILTFFTWIYDEAEPLNSDFVSSRIIDMIRGRRLRNILKEPAELDTLAKKLNTLSFDFKELQMNDGEQISFFPFDAPMIKAERKVYKTGFPLIDAKIKGIGEQEFALIIGHSGAGKTAVAVHSAISNALEGIRVMFLTIEEPAQAIMNRFYANFFCMNYSELHRSTPLAQAELRAKFADLSEHDQKILRNLNVQDLAASGVALTAQGIGEFLDRFCEQTGFAPELVYIDQMDYLDSDQEYDSAWQKYSNIAFEVERLTANHLIGGIHKFSVYLLHQAGGKMKRQYSNADIAGFKGVIKPTDLTLAIGKDSPEDKVVSLFSIKCRHDANFSVDHIADMQYMRFSGLDKGSIAGADAERQLVPKHGRGRGKKKSDDFPPERTEKAKFANIPDRAEVLPPPGGAFV